MFVLVQWPLDAFFAHFLESYMSWHGTTVRPGVSGGGEGGMKAEGTAGDGGASGGGIS